MPAISREKSCRKFNRSIGRVGEPERNRSPSSRRDSEGLPSRPDPDPMLSPLLDERSGRGRRAEVSMAPRREISRRAERSRLKNVPRGGPRYSVRPRDTPSLSPGLQPFRPRNRALMASNPVKIGRRRSKAFSAATSLLPEKICGPGLCGPIFSGCLFGPLMRSRFRPFGLQPFRPSG